MKSFEDTDFNTQEFVEAAGVEWRVQPYGRGDIILTQGGPCDRVCYLQRGGVKVSVTSRSGCEAVLRMLASGAFFGEGGLTGLATYPTTATATTASTVLIVSKDDMLRALRSNHAMSDRFIAHLLARNIRAGEDVLDQLFNSCEKRLARTLILLAQQGTHATMGAGGPRPTQAISQLTLAEMVGTTRPRVNSFLQKFERQGWIDMTNGLTVNASLLATLDD